MSSRGRTRGKRKRKRKRVEKDANSTDLSREVGKLYRDPKFPGSFGGIKKFFRALQEKGKKLTEKDLKQWLKEDDLYQLHKPSRKSFPRRSIIVHGIDHLWQLDLSDVSSLKKYNGGNRFLLFAIDGFSKHAWVQPLKDKTGSVLTEAMKRIFETSGRTPLHIQTDKGGEFVNRPFKELLKSKNVNFYTSQNEETKAAFVERLQRTFKTKMFRYFTDRNTLRYTDVLQDLMQSYNNTTHSSIGKKPAEVSRDNEAEVRAKLAEIWKRPPPKESKSSPQVGDHVRLSIARHPFRKGYLPQWTEEIFTVHKVLKTKPTTYRLADLQGEVIEGTFYVQELQKVPKKSDRVYRVEKILKTRRRGRRKEFFVKWLGYPKNFNSWIREEDMT